MNTNVICPLCITYSVSEIALLKGLQSKKPKQKRNPAMFKLQQLKDKIPLFDNIRFEELQTILSHVAFEHFAVDSTIIQEGDDGDTLYLLLAGECKIMKAKRAIGDLYGGDIFGEMGALFDEPRTASIYANSDDVTVLALTFDKRKIETHPKIFMNLFRAVAKQLSHKLHHPHGY
jgi:CRP-like cAMP-binding protein